MASEEQSPLVWFSEGVHGPRGLQLTGSPGLVKRPAVRQGRSVDPLSEGPGALRSRQKGLRGGCWRPAGEEPWPDGHVERRPADTSAFPY